MDTKCQRSYWSLYKDEPGCTWAPEEMCFQSFHGILAFYKPNQISSFENKCQALKHQTLRTLGSLMTFCLFGRRARMEGSQTQHPPPKLAWSRRVLVTVWFEVGGLNKEKVATWGDLGISSRALASGEPTQRLASSNIIFAWKYTAFKMPSQVLSFDARLSLSGG